MTAWSSSCRHAFARAPSKVTTAQVFAIAGPAMVANLTTPLIGIVSTTAIGRLGDATLLGGVAMASRAVRLHVLAVRLPAHEHGGASRRNRSAPARRIELRAILVRGADRCGAGRRGADRAADPAGRDPAQRDGRQRGRHARGKDLFRDPDLVGAAGARQLRRAGLADRTGARRSWRSALQITINLINVAATALLVLVLDFGIAGAAIAAVIAESGRARARPGDRAPLSDGQLAAAARQAVRPRQADADARGQPRHHDPHRVADRGVAVLYRAGRPRRRHRRSPPMRC